VVDENQEKRESCLNTAEAGGFGEYDINKCTDDNPPTVDPNHQAAQYCTGACRDVCGPSMDQSECTAYAGVSAAIVRGFLPLSLSPALMADNSETQIDPGFLPLSLSRTRSITYKKMGVVLLQTKEQIQCSYDWCIKYGIPINNECIYLKN
jgi:hypothetical protein